MRFKFSYLEGRKKIQRKEREIEKRKRKKRKKKEETPCTIVVSYTVVGWPRIYNNNIGMIIHTLTLLIFTLEMYAAPGYVYATLFS